MLSPNKATVPHELVWVIDDDKSIRWVLEKALQAEGIETESFVDGTGIMQQLSNSKPAAIISDIRMPGIDGLKLLNEISGLYPEIPVIITTAHSDLESAVSSYQGGAFEYLPKPFDTDEAVAVTQRALAYSREQSSAAQHRIMKPPRSLARRLRCRKYSAPLADCHAQI